MIIFAKRAAALIALALAVFFSWWGASVQTAYGIAFVVVLCVLLDGLCQPLPSSMRHWRDYHSTREFLAFLFSPGWASASLFSLLIFCVSLKILEWEQVSKEPRLELIFISLFAMVLWPAALVRFLFPRTLYFVTFYFLFQLIGSTLALLAYEMPQKTGGFWDVLICFAPSAVFFLAIKHTLPAAGLDIYRWISTILCYLSFFLLLTRMFLISMRWSEKR